MLETATIEKKSRKVNLICKQCNKLFDQTSHGKTQTFCSIECRNDSLRRLEKVNKQCNKYTVDPKSARKSVSCSQKCYDKYRGSLVIGKCIVCDKEIKARQTTNRDKKKIFCSKVCSGNYIMTLSPPKHYKEKKIWHLLKDGLEVKCETCGNDDIDILTVHHADENKHNNEISNLQLLCANCHYKIHHNGSARIRDYIRRLKTAINKIDG